jgi:hypothetical protein
MLDAFQHGDLGLVAAVALIDGSEDGTDAPCQAKGDSGEARYHHAGDR